MTKLLRKLFFSTTGALKEFLSLALLWLPDMRPKPERQEIPVIASMTTYPPRIAKAWIAIETLLRQTVRPIKLILVLSKEEFPTEVVPRSIQRQVRRGLEILWVDKTAGSYDKLIPVRQAYPQHAIVTFDDDKFFPRSLLANLYEASLLHPDSIVGSRGWVVRQENGEIRYGSNWLRAEPGSKGSNIFTPGGNGCLYPPQSLHPVVDNLKLALELCPTADDIWFWFAAQKAGSLVYCLGMEPHRSVRSQARTPALAERNALQNDVQFQEMAQKFGLPSDSSRWDQ